MKKQKGFTLMELTIVLAILAIIAAILIPVFFHTTDRARLRGDIQSARVIYNAMALYRAERGQDAARNNENNSAADMATVLNRLRAAGFTTVTPTDTQTDGAVWALYRNAANQEIRVVVDISGSGSHIRETFSRLTTDEQRYVIGYLIENGGSY